jgi:hypothetical protein
MNRFLVLVTFCFAFALVIFLAHRVRDTADDVHDAPSLLRIRQAVQPDVLRAWPRTPVEPHNRG